MNQIELINSLIAHGINRTDRIIEFHEKHGGQVEFNGLNKWVWGIVHDSPMEMNPNELEVLQPEGPADVHLVQCVDADPQDALFLDQNGAVYDCCGRKSFGSFESMFKYHKFLESYVCAYENWNEVKESEFNIIKQSTQFDEYADEVFILRRWGEFIIKIENNSITELYKVAE